MLPCVHSKAEFLEEYSQSDEACEEKCSETIFSYSFAVQMV